MNIKYRYSPFSLDIESEQIGLLKTARELGVAIVAYSPIGRGMLGGQIRSPDDFEEGDFRKWAPRFSADQIRVTTIGATIGTHGGPRVMGVTWLDPA